MNLLVVRPLFYVSESDNSETPVQLEVLEYWNKLGQREFYVYIYIYIYIYVYIYVYVYKK